MGSLALIVGSERPTQIRTFAPLKSKPAQILIHALDKLFLAAGVIDVLVSQNEGTAIFRSTLLGHPKSARMTEMQMTSRRGGQSTPIVGDSLRYGCLIDQSTRDIGISVDAAVSQE